MDSIFLGAILVDLVHHDHHQGARGTRAEPRSAFAQLIFGILIVEDILAIVMIALLSGFATTGSFAAADVGMTVLKLGSFLGILLVAGLILVPRLLNYVARFKSNEMLLVTVLGLCFGVSLLAVRLGYSVALGAFLIGAIIAEARQIARDRDAARTGARYVQRGLLRLDRVADRSGAAGATMPVRFSSSPRSSSWARCSPARSARSSLATTGGLRCGWAWGWRRSASSRSSSPRSGLSLKVTSGFLYPIAVAVSALTTLTTPYLIKNSDSVIEWFDRAAPLPVKRWLDFYTRWTSELAEGERHFGLGLARKWGWQIALNLIFITGIFIAAGAMRSRGLTWWPEIPRGEDGVKAALWLGAMLLSLPLLIAVFRKLRALAMLLSEMSVTRVAGGVNTNSLRSVVANTIVAAGCIMLVLIILLLSSTILPSWKLLLVQALIVTVTAILLRRSFTKLYSKAQFALQETLAQAPVRRHDAGETTLPAMMREAQIATIRIGKAASVAGKLIGELRLRTNTGASIVGIQRGDEKHYQSGSR